MDSPHRKIELQSPADLTFLTSRIRQAALQKLDLHLPPVADAGDSPDELRRHVEALVDAFVASVLCGMRENISINGMDVVARESRGKGGRASEEAEAEATGGGAEGLPRAGAALPVAAAEQEEYEPFDDKLRARLAAQVARRDALVAAISRHRRATPAAAAQAWIRRFERERDLSAAEMAEVQRLAAVAGAREELAVGELARADEVQTSWERAVEGLARLNKGLPETRARLERCGDVVGYLAGEKK